MDNQHRRISGYRELNEAEIKLMNEIKALGPIVETVLLKVQDHINRQQIVSMNMGDTAEAKAEQDRLNDATPSRFVALAKTDFQTALMYLTRGVAQPTFF